MPKTPSSCPQNGDRSFFNSICAALFAVIAVFSFASAQTDTAAARVPVPDSSTVSDTGSELDSTVSAALLPPTVKAHALPEGQDAASDSFDISSGLYLSGGAGLSIGSASVFTMWKNGLPSRLSDFGLSDTSFLGAGGPGDTLRLYFRTVKAPDAYNMTFPLSIALGMLSGRDRFAAAASFTILTKDSRISIDIGQDADSTGRRLDIHQSLGLYAVTIDLMYGLTIPDRFFTIDKSDRTDLVAGVSVSPFIGLSRVISDDGVPDSLSDPRLWSVRGTAMDDLGSVSASGIALGWRLGISKMRRLSKNGGIEGRLCWTGSWSTGFRTSDGTLTEKEISPKSPVPDRKISYVSNRFEISIALIRKLR